jgi:hypothetical protein
MSPNNKSEALVMSDSCGATCKCAVRVDVKAANSYQKQIWRGLDACDATVTWLNNAKLNIVDDNGKQTQIDLKMNGLSP